MRALAIFASIFGLLLVSMLAEAQRNFFGKEQGNLLLLLEFGALVVTAVVSHLWRNNKRTLGVCIGSLSLGLALAFLGWFVHPDQIHSRALERVLDWDRVLSNYKFEQSMGNRDPDATVRLQRLTQELAARQSEYRAAEIRYTGEPEFFRSAFWTWSLWFFGVVFGAFGIRYARQYFRRGA